MSLPIRIFTRRADHEGLVHAVIAWLQRRIKLQDLAVALIHGVACLFGYVLAFVVVDHALTGGLSRVARLFTIWTCAAAALAMVLRYAVIPFLRRINALYVAALIERRFPDLRNSLITSLELTHESRVQPGVAAGLLDRTAHALTEHDLAACVPTRGLARATVAAAATIVLLLAYCAIAPKAVWPSLQRAFGASVAAPTRTQIDWLAPGEDATCVRGTALTFEARLRGRMPLEAHVEFSADNGRTWDRDRRLTMAPADDVVDAVTPLWRAILPAHDAQATLVCRITAGDAVTPPRRIRVRPAPTVTQLRVVCRPPAYARLPDESHDGGDVDALVGTRVELSVRGNVTLAGGDLRFEDGGGTTRRPMQLDSSDPQRLTTSWIVNEDAEYRVVLHDPEGAANLRPLTYRQRAREDRPPRVELRAPIEDQTLDADASFELRATAADDIGLHDLTLVYRNGVVGGRMNVPGLGRHQSGTVVSPVSSLPEPRDAQIAARVPVSAFAARAGDVIEWHLEARDNRCDPRGQPAYQIGASASRTLRINLATVHARQKGGATTDAASRPAIQPLDADAGAKPGTSSQETDRADGSTNGPSDSTGDAAQSGPTSRPNGGAEPAGDDSAGSQPAGGDAASQPAGGQAASQPAGTGDTGAAASGPADGNREAVRKLVEKYGGDPPKKSDAGKKDGDKGDGSEKKPDDATRGDKPKEPDGKKPSDADKSRDKETEKKGGSDGKNDAKPNEKDGGQSGGDKGEGGGKKPGGADDSKPGDSKKGNGEGGGDTESKQTGDGRQPGGGGKEAKGDGASKDDGNKQSDAKQGGGKPKNDGSSKGNGGKQGGSKAGGDKPRADGGSKRDGSSKDDPKKDDAKKGGDSRPTGKGGDAKGGKSGDGRPTGDGGAGDTGGDRDKPKDEKGDPSDGGFKEEGRGKNKPIDAGRVEKAVDELEKRLREGTIDEKELKDLGWTRAQAESFVREFRRRQQASRERDASANRPTGNGPANGPRAQRVGAGTGGDDEARLGDRTAAGVSGGTNADDASKKTTPDLSDQPHEDVPQDYRDLLDAYYREMARNGPAR